jgi:hypothetical protein
LAATGEAPLNARQELLEVGLGRHGDGVSDRQPPQLSSRALRPDCVRCIGGEQESEVSVLVRGLFAPGWNRHDRHLAQLSIRPGGEVGQACFLAALTDGDCQRIGFAGVGVAANLQPGLLTLVPAEQNPAARRMNDARRRRDVQRNGPRPGISGAFRERENSLPVGSLLIVLRLILAQQVNDAVMVVVAGGRGHIGETTCGGISRTG